MEEEQGLVKEEGQGLVKEKEQGHVKVKEQGSFKEEGQGLVKEKEQGLVKEKEQGLVEVKEHGSFKDCWTSITKRFGFNSKADRDQSTTETNVINLLQQRLDGFSRGKQEGLKEKIVSDIVENFMVITSPKLVHLFNKLPFDIVFEVLKSSNLNVDSEFHVYNALSSWAENARNTNALSYNQEITSLLCHIRFDHIDSTLIDNELKKKDDNPMIEQLREVYSLETKNHEPRAWKQLEYMMIVGGLYSDGERLTKMQITPLYETKEVKSCYDWEIFDQLEEFRLSFGVTYHDGKIYVCGGNDTHMETLRSLKSYDIKSKEWCPLQDMPAKRIHLVLVAHEGKLIACGGNEEREGTKTAFFYDITENQWEEGSRDMRYARNGHCGVVVDNEFYVMGGYNTEKFCEKMVSLKDEPKWKDIASTNHGRSNATACFHTDNRIYLAGGEDERHRIQNSIEFYTPAKGTNEAWTLLKDQSWLYYERRYGVLVSFTSNLFIIGGQDDNMRNVDVVEGLDTKKLHVSEDALFGSSDGPKWYKHSRLERGIVNHGVIKCNLPNYPELKLCQ